MQNMCWGCKICVENATKKDDIKETNTEQKKEEEHRCSDDQNQRVYKQKKKGKLKKNGSVLLKWLAREIIWVLYSCNIRSGLVC